MVATGEDLARVRWDLKIEFIENTLIFVDVAKLLFKIVSDIQSLNRLLSITYVPNMHGKVVSWENVVITCRRKFSLANWLDYLCEEILSGGLGFLFDFDGEVWEFRWDA